MRWSQLKKLVTALWVPELDLDIHCTAFRRDGASDIGRYWITFSKVTIWEVPEDIESELKSNRDNPVATEVTGVLRRYIDSSKERIVSGPLEGDRWGLTQLLMIVDRRVGKRRLYEINQDSLRPELRGLLIARLKA